MNLQVYDWNKDFEKIISSTFLAKSPFIIKSFFQINDGIAKFEDELVSQLVQFKIETQEFNLQEFKRRIVNQSYVPLRKEHLYYSEYKKKTSLKTGENLIPERWAEALSAKININRLRYLVPPETNESYYFRFFVGFEGQETDPHFDWSNYHNILFQLYGKKEVYIVNPESFHKIPFIANFSELNINQLLSYAEEAQISVVRVIIEDGDGLFIPPYCLHAVKYLTNSSSLSLRFLPVLEDENKVRMYPPSFILARSLWERRDIALKNETFLDVLRRLEKGVLFEKHERSIYSEDYENYLYKKMNSFEGVASEALRKAKLQSRGACHFIKSKT